MGNLTILGWIFTKGIDIATSNTFSDLIYLVSQSSYRKSNKCDIVIRLNYNGWLRGTDVCWLLLRGTKLSFFCTEES